MMMNRTCISRPVTKSAFLHSPVFEVDFFDCPGVTGQHPNHDG
jgi:hypothetical protein